MHFSFCDPLAYSGICRMWDGYNEGGAPPPPPPLHEYLRQHGMRSVCGGGGGGIHIL